MTCLPEKMPITGMRLPEPCRLGLAELHAAMRTAEAEAQHAKALYNAASNSALTALGFDLKDDLHLNLDSGEITVKSEE